MEVLEKREEASGLPAATALDPRWAVVEHITASKNFSKSGRLRSFLLYIVQCTIENRTEEVTEQQIGIHVFGRDPGYNSAEDNIVRITARQLRQRLALYYQEEGSHDEIRIEVPRGGYLPVFQVAGAVLVESTAPGTPPTIEEHLVKTASFWRGSLLQRLRAPAFVLLGAAFALLIQWGVSVERLHASATDVLWRILFSDKQTTLFVPGDAGLNMFNNLAHMPRQLSLADYIGGKYLYSLKAQTPEFAGAPIGSRRYVNIADLQFADRIPSLPRFRRENYQIRFPRDMTPDDFRNVNVILSGAPVYNPWDELFDSRLNFHIVYNGDGQNSMFVENRKPLAGEPSIYNTDWKHVFGYIALTDNLDNNGKVLLIEGTSHIGVEAAVDFLLNDKKMEPILAKARQNNSSLSNFEILLDAAAPNNSGSGQSEVLTTRFYSN